MRTENEKPASKWKSSAKLRKTIKNFLDSGEARVEDAGFLLDLLESGCSRDEIETAMGLTLHDEKTVVRYIMKRRKAFFDQAEKRFGFGFSLLLCLQLRLRKANEAQTLLRTFAYPSLLIFSGYCVLAMYLFVIGVTIEANRSLFQTSPTIPLYYLQVLFLLFSLSALVLSGILFHQLALHPNNVYVTLSKSFPINPWSIAISRRMAFHITKLHALGLSTREIYQVIAAFPKEPILASIAVKILEELATGNALRSSLKTLDPFLIRILSFDAHPDFATRLKDYDRIAQKRYAYSVKKLGYTLSVIAYLFISVLIFTLYREIMAPLDMLKNMG